MTTIQVYDPAMCCSTGVCGQTVDPQLVRFAADLDWLKTQGVAVERFNLSQEPLAFAKDAEVKAALQEKGEGALPLIKAGGIVWSMGTYPSREQLATWVGMDAPAPSIYTEAVQELVAIGAAIASNCQPCFKYHYDKARKLGVSREDMFQAVRTAQMVKDAPAQAVWELAERFLCKPTGVTGEELEGNQQQAAPSPGCCGGSSESGGSCA